MNFGHMNDLGEGEANLLDTIRCPRVLSQLNQNLPSSTPNKSRAKFQSHHNGPSTPSNPSIGKNRAISIHSDHHQKHIKIKKVSILSY